MRSPFSDFRLRTLERIRLNELQTSLLLAAVVGAGGAVATVAFREFLDLLRNLVYGQASGLVEIARRLPWWGRIWIPMAGGLCAGVVLQWAKRFDLEGKPTDYMEAITLADGQIGVRSSLGRAFSSAISVVSGASIGREAPMVQLAALAGSLLGRWRRFARPKQRLMVACGAAAGICTAYNAPIAGALFIAEIVLKSLAIESLGPLMVSSAVANLVSHQFLGYAPIYQMPTFVLRSGWDAVPFVLVGICAGVCAPFFLYALEVAKRLFSGIPTPLWMRLSLGGLLVGAVSAFEPAVWGNGYSVVNSILNDNWAWQALLGLLVFKVLATGFSVGSGAVGGVFTPTLFVGAALGSILGQLLHGAWPGLSPVSAYIATGMGAFLAASTHASLMSAVMIFEMTGNTQIIVPLLLVCVLSVTVKRIISENSVYAKAIAPKAKSFNVRDLLRKDPPTVGEQNSCTEIERVFLARRWPHVYVVDQVGQFVGALSLHDFAPWLRGSGNPEASIPPELIRRDYPRLWPSSSMGEVLEALQRHSGERLPVLDESGRLLGYVSKSDVLLAIQENGDRMPE